MLETMRENERTASAFKLTANAPDFIRKNMTELNWNRPEILLARRQIGADLLELEMEKVRMNRKARMAAKREHRELQHAKTLEIARRASAVGKQNRLAKAQTRKWDPNAH